MPNGETLGGYIYSLVQQDIKQGVPFCKTIPKIDKMIREAREAEKAFAEREARA